MLLLKLSKNQMIKLFEKLQFKKAIFKTYFKNSN